MTGFSAALAFLPASLLFCHPAAASDIQATLDKVRLSQDVPGVSATIVHKGEQVWSGGSGLADIEAGTAMRGDTPVHAGSLSKVFTSALTLALVEQNKIRLDDNVSSIAGRNDVTVTNLLTHTSGLDREGDFNYWFNARFPGRDRLSRYLENTQLQSEPGERVSYSNIGFAALGLHIEQSSGRNYETTLRDFLLEPLGIKNTGAPGPVENIARGYTPPGQIIPNAARPFAGVGVSIGDRRYREYHDARAMAPAFGLYTTSADLGRLASFVLGYNAPELMSDKLRRRLLESHDGGRTLGLGITRRDGRRIAGHGGWFAAHRSYLLIDPANEIGIAVIGNGDNTDARAIAYELLESVVSDTD